MFAQSVNRTKMFHVKHFGTIGEKTSRAAPRMLAAPARAAQPITVARRPKIPPRRRASSYRGKLRPWAPSRARMTIAICPEISSAPRIVRPEALHAVGDGVPTWQRAIARGVIAGRRRSIIRARIIIWFGAIIVRRRQCTADHGPGDNCSGHRSTPSPTPTPAPPLHGLDRAWRRILDRKPINSRCSRCGADEPSHARDH